VRSLLAIETSCDETAAAVIDDDGTVRSSIVASQTDVHADFGGVVPELASRAHVELISSVVGRALDQAGVSGVDLDAVAVTSGPGLVGALLVGIAYAKALALGWGIPVVEVNHLEAHLASVYLADGDVPFPQTALLVSGGHCMLTRATAPGRYSLLGETVDDSIGEAYDKVARFLGLGYPGGPVLDRLAAGYDSGSGSGSDSGSGSGSHAGSGSGSHSGSGFRSIDPIRFPRPMLDQGYSFSFSGLKTAVVNYVRANPGVPVAEVAASFVAACMDVLCAKLRRALEEFGDPAVAIVGGVAASPILRDRAQTLADEFGTRLLIPPQVMATDNAAMIGIAGWQRLSSIGPIDPSFGPQPDLRLRFA
jgi:N6-L-threonylcarbamoyladenine synthase